MGQQGRLTRVWSKKGDRPRLTKDMRFEYAYIYGAICPERDCGEALVIKSVCKQAMQHHLNAISSNIPDDRHGVLVLDNAPWHKSLTVPPNLTIVHLPPYSPELNPHENIWEYMKNNFLSNRVYQNLEHVITACCQAWNALCEDKGRIASIGKRQWITIN